MFWLAKQETSTGVHIVENDFVVPTILLFSITEASAVIGHNKFCAKMSVRVDNNAYELIITPNKRKRANDDKIRSNSTVNCCSSNKENHFVFNNFMEVKSIAEIFAQRKEISGLETENPYEVTRKPPKKKSKHELDNGCFENPALNLNVPEKILNPFEVKREPVVPVNNHCFVNSGLNLRSVDREVRNPFEVTRDHPPTPKEVHGKLFTEAQLI